MCLSFFIVRLGRARFSRQNGLQVAKYAIVGYTFTNYMNLNLRKAISISILTVFLFNTFGPIPMVQANDFILPTPGARVHLSPHFDPPMLKGIKVHPDNPFRFDFILDKGDTPTNEPLNVKATQRNKPNDDQELRTEATRLIKYFLASLTIPEKDLWVNLSPYEKNRIVPESFGLTEMGRDLLAEDYMLKQITASLMYPEDDIGKKFWKRVYQEAAKKFGTTDIPVNTFNKVWVIPEKAVVYENAGAGTAYVVESKLKVMLEQDYLALSKNQGETNQMPTRGHAPERGVSPSTLPNELGKNVKALQGNPLTPSKDINALGSQIVREIVIPILEKEINEGKNFAQLRQVYNSLILAMWFKDKVRQSLFKKAYVDQNKTGGIDIKDKTQKDKIWAQYVQAFKKGAYNYIKEDYGPVTQQTVPRKYFSGGVDFAMGSHTTTFEGTSNLVLTTHDPDSLSEGISNRAIIIEANFTPFDKAMNSGVSPERHRIILEIYSFLTGMARAIKDEIEKQDPDAAFAQLDQWLEHNQGKTDEMLIQEGDIDSVLSLYDSFLKKLTSVSLVMSQEKQKISGQMDVAFDVALYDISDKLPKILDPLSLQSSTIKGLRHYSKKDKNFWASIQKNTKIVKFRLSGYRQMISDILDPASMDRTIDRRGFESQSLPEKIYTSFLLPYYDVITSVSADHAMLALKNQENFTSSIYWEKDSRYLLKALIVKRMSQVFLKEDDQMLFQNFVAHGELDKAKEMLGTRPSFYQDFQREPKTAVYPGGLDLRIFDLFPDLKEVHFINNMPFRVPFNIDHLSIVGMTKAQSSIKGQEAFKEMITGYLQQSEYHNYIETHTQLALVHPYSDETHSYLTDRYQIGLEPFIRANLEYRQASDIRITPQTGLAETYVIRFKDVLGVDRTIYFHQCDVFEADQYPQALQQALRPKKIDMFFIKAFTEDYNLFPEELRAGVKQGALFIKDSFNIGAMDQEEQDRFLKKWDLTKIGRLAGNNSPWGPMGYNFPDYEHMDHGLQVFRMPYGELSSTNSQPDYAMAGANEKYTDGKGHLHKHSFTLPAVPRTVPGKVTVMNETLSEEVFQALQAKGYLDSEGSVSSKFDPDTDYDRLNDYGIDEVGGQTLPETLGLDRKFSLIYADILMIMRDAVKKRDAQANVSFDRMPPQMAKSKEGEILNQVYWTVKVKNATGETPYVVGINHFYKGEEAFIDTNRHIAYEIFAAPLDRFKAAGFSKNDYKGSVVLTFDEQNVLNNDLFNFSIQDNRRLEYPWLYGIIRLRLSSQMSKPFDSRSLALHATIEDALKDEPYLVDETVFDVKAAEYQYNQQSQLRRFFYFANQSLREHGYESAKVMAQDDMLLTGKDVVNVGYIGDLREDELSLLQAASHFGNINLFSMNRAKRASYGTIVGAPLFMFKSGTPVVNKNPLDVPLDYVINLDARFDDLLGKSVVPEPGQPLEDNYIGLKDISMIELEKRGVTVPRWRAIIVSDRDYIRKGIFVQDMISRKRTSSKNVIRLNSKDRDLEFQLEKELKSFLLENKITAGVAKPNDGQCGYGVVFFNRLDLHRKIDEIYEMVRNGINIIVQERVTPPFVKRDNDTLDWNVRVFVTGNEKGRLAKVVRIDKEGKAINISQSAKPWLLEKVSQELNLTPKEYQDMEKAIDDESHKSFQAINQAMDDDKVKQKEQNAVDYMGVDVIVRHNAGKFSAYVIEVNDFHSGAAWDLDKALRDAPVELVSSEEASRRIGEASQGWLETIYRRALAYKNQGPHNADHAMISQEIIFPEDRHASIEGLGEKPDKLIKLKQAGFNIAKFFVVKSDGSGRLEMNDTLLRKAFNSLQKPVIVRSAHPDEGRNHPFSGVFESFDNISVLTQDEVPKKDISEEDAWFKLPESVESAYKDIVNNARDGYKSHKYRKDLGVTDFDPNKMDVVIMEQVDIDVFGMFVTSTHDPDRMLIHYEIRGEEGKASGGAIGYNKKTHALDENKLSEHLQSVLPEFGETAAKIESLFGVQQVELASSKKDGKVYVLQSRTINLGNPEDVPRLAQYKSLGLGEAYSYGGALEAIGYGNYRLPVLVIDNLENATHYRSSPEYISLQRELTEARTANDEQKVSELRSKERDLRKALKDKYQQELLAFQQSHPEYILVIKDAQDVLVDSFKMSAYQLINSLTTNAKVIIRGRNQTAIRHNDWDNIDLGRGITIIPPEIGSFMDHFQYTMNEGPFREGEDVAYKRDKILVQHPRSIGTGNYLNVLSNTDGVFVWYDDKMNQPLDKALIANSAQNGGIDLTRDKMNLQVHKERDGIGFSFDPVMLQQLQNVSGFVPVIINIQPMTDLRQFLGLSVQESNPTAR
ncbi:MAG: hypothetical protein HQL12_04565 [Candidatus Omnitrophica bacterium]|nr:hypothetical protein [Candidatus Omnitrophota bacterium]